jgi:diguanylate cyclase (GGDEF)-like protein
LQKILIVDDVPANIKILRELLIGDFELFLATNGEMAVEVAESKVPDLILMDVMMPVMDGIMACEILHAKPSTAAIPVIFITAKNEVEDMVKGFEVGGVDYVTKPFNPAELNARVKTHLELKASREQLLKSRRQLEDANKQLEDRNDQLNRAIEQLNVAVMTDPLTGLHNRRYMTQAIEQEKLRFKRTQRPFTLVISDIDHFKGVNDTYGHECGDEVLKQVSRTIRGLLRDQDHVARWGGEEFLMMLPETNLNGATLVADRIRLAVAETDTSCANHEVKVTMTFGVAEFANIVSVDEIIRNADSALYDGKEAGRNRVVAYSSEATIG